MLPENLEKKIRRQIDVSAARFSCFQMVNGGHNWVRDVSDLLHVPQENERGKKKSLWKTF